MDEVSIAPVGVRLAPTTLFDAVCVALESGEFVQVREMMADGGNGRCAWGVAATVCQRAGVVNGLCWHSVHPELRAIERRAGQMLGYDCIASANDAGEHLAIIAAALRAARVEIEAEKSDGS